MRFVLFLTIFFLARLEIFYNKSSFIVTILTVLILYRFIFLILTLIYFFNFNFYNFNFLSIFLYRLICYNDAFFSNNYNIPGLVPPILSTRITLPFCDLVIVAQTLHFSISIQILFLFMSFNTIT